MFEANKIKQATLEKRSAAEVEEQMAALKGQPDQKVQVQKEKELLEAEKVFREGIVSVRDIIAPAAFKVESKCLQLNDLFVRTIFVVTYPRYVTIGWFAPIINESLTLDISMFFYPLAINIVLKQLRNKVEIIRLFNIAPKKFFIRIIKKLFFPNTIFFLMYRIIYSLDLF
jgi:hypothetical protein